MNIVVLVTAKDMLEAQKISEALIEKKWIACVNIMPKVMSIFSWKGKVEKADEVLMIMKTQQKYFEDICKAVKLLHSYDTPEIIGLPILVGDQDYLNWIKESLSS